MIPVFPQFKPIELSDKSQIEKITKQFPPYSDFNFTSLWSWNIKDEMLVSELNGNLVVKFTDYVTGEPFYSFFGINKIDDTIKKLLDCSIEEEIKPRLNLIPEHVAQHVNKQKYKITEDPDNFDYIYDITELSNHVGKKFLSQRNKINKFLRDFPNVRIEVLDLKSREVQQQIIKLDELWITNKTKKDQHFKFKNELHATRKFFETDFSDTVGLGVYIVEKLIGYSIFSILSDGHAISHFTKADVRCVGVYEFILKESAKKLAENNCKLLNYEQDLGLPGLRKNKKCYMSSHYKKFVVSFND